MTIADFLCGAVAIIAWIAGVVLAKGFWLTTVAVCFPFYAWYLLIEYAMKTFGVVI